MKNINILKSQFNSSTQILNIFGAVNLSHIFNCYKLIFFKSNTLKKKNFKLKNKFRRKTKLDLNLFYKFMSTKQLTQSQIFLTNLYKYLKIKKFLYKIFKIQLQKKKSIN